MVPHLYLSIGKFWVRKRQIVNYIMNQMLDQLSARKSMAKLRHLDLYIRA